MTGGTHTCRRTCSRTVSDPTIGPAEVCGLDTGIAALGALSQFHTSLSNNYLITT